MKIICTKAEQEIIIETFEKYSNQCLFQNDNNVDCSLFPKCHKCVEKNIDWEITD